MNARFYLRPGWKFHFSYDRVPMAGHKDKLGAIRVGPVLFLFSRTISLKGKR